MINKVKCVLRFKIVERIAYKFVFRQCTVVGGNSSISKVQHEIAYVTPNGIRIVQNEQALESRKCGLQTNKLK